MQGKGESQHPHDRKQTPSINTWGTEKWGRNGLCLLGSVAIPQGVHIRQRRNSEAVHEVYSLLPEAV